MTIEEKLRERLKAQGWGYANAIRSGAAPGWFVRCVMGTEEGCFEIVRQGYGWLTAERAMEIEAWFKEKLKDA